MNPSPTALEARVIALRDLSPTVREITLRPAAGATLAWTVGSHLRVQVQLADGRVDTRRYSLVGLPQPGADWRIAVKRVLPGRGGSAFMWRLAVGDAVAVDAPANHFELPPSPLRSSLASRRADGATADESPDERPQTLLLAAGIGITPLLGMALTLAARQASLHMCYAARTEAELVYADELRAALGARLQTFCSAQGQRVALEAEIAALHPQGQMLVCGPLGLLGEARAAWARAGRPPQRLRFETFGSSGARPAEAFRVEVPRHGLSLEVPADRSLLEVLDAHGVQVLHDCLRGECGLCAVDVLAVDGEIDHRDVFLSAAEKQAGRRLCACVSRVCGGGIVVDSAWRPDDGPA
jgi:ferredoxin-NADP reductase